MTVIVRQLFEHQSGDGSERGTLVIRDAETGKKKVQARFESADINEISQGILVGTVRDGNQSRRLFANWRVTFHESGAVTAQIGGVAPDGRLPALIISGRCTGPFETEEEVILPPPDGAAAANRASSTRVGWLRR